MLKRILKDYGTLIALLAVCAIFAALNPRAFLSGQNIWNITRQMAILCIISLGTTMIMSVGEFDLSVGNTASLGGVIAAVMAISGVPFPVCMLASVLAGAIIGFANGFIVTRFSVMSFIITLAAGRVVYGITYALSGGAIVFNGIPESFSTLGTARLGPMPLLTVLMILSILVFLVIMTRTPLGRRLYAIGGNEEASRVAGIKVDFNKTVAFTAAGAMAAFAGVLLASRVGSASPTGGDAYCLNAYATVFIGKTVRRNGVPNVLGTAVGALLFTIIANGLTIMLVPTYMQNIATGLIIVLAVIAQRAGRSDD